MSTVKEIIAARSSFDVNASNIDTLITLATTTRLSINAFDNVDTFNYAVALLVMHWLTLNKQMLVTNNVGGVGGIKSLSEGQLSMSFGSPSGNSLNTVLPEYQSTAYGLELSGFLESYIVPIVTRFG